MNEASPEEGARSMRSRPSLLAVVALVGLALLAWHLSHILLLVFGGVLLAIFLRHAAEGICRRTGLPVRLALLLVILAVVLAIVGIIAWIGPQTARQFEILWASLPGAIERVEASLRASQFGGFLLDQMVGSNGGAPPDLNILGRLGGTLSATVNILFEIVIVITVAIFLAVDPGLYRRGLLRLVPLHRRGRAVEVMDTISDGLWYWLLGQFASMLLVGIVAGVGLALLGVPLAAVLGLIAGITNFIPQVGPYIAAVPAVLIAFTEDPMLAVYAALLFFAIHQVEGNIILPLIQKRATNLPPVLTVVIVVVGGVLFGALGLLLATPLLYVVMVLVRMLYVEDMLGDDMTGPSSPDGDAGAPAES